MAITDRERASCVRLKALGATTQAKAVAQSEMGGPPRYRLVSEGYAREVVKNGVVCFYLTAQGLLAAGG